MAGLAWSQGEDTAEKFFGTPERKLRRRHLHPWGWGASEVEGENGESQTCDREETDNDDLQPPPSDTVTEPDMTSQPRPATTTISLTDSVLAFFLHLTAVSFYLFVLVNTNGRLDRLQREKSEVIPGFDTYGGRWKDLTHINLNIQAVYFVLALSCDLSPWLRKRLQGFLDFTFTTVALPCAMSITVLFWIFLLCSYVGGPPLSVYQFLPTIVYHYWHTAVGFGALLELVLVYHHYPSGQDALLSISIWNIGYAAWVYWCYFIDNTLPYPMLQILGPYLFPLLFVCIFEFSLIFFYFGKILTRWCW